LVAPIQIETEIAVSAGANAYSFTLKSAGLTLTRDRAAVLGNGRWVVSGAWNLQRNRSKLA
jgi:hypothetical protein